MFICAQLDASGGCAVWSEYFGLLPPLTTADGLLIAGAAYGVWGLAWGVRQVVGLITNR